MSAVFWPRRFFKTKSYCTFCKGFLILLILLELRLILLLFELAVSNGPATGVNTYPTFSDAKQRFLNSLGSFSVMRSVDPNVVSSSYLSSPKLTARDKNLLQYFIDDYISFHKRNRYNATRRLIFTPLRTGIGDRMVCLLFAYWAAVLSKRVFLVNWQSPFPLHEFLTEANGLKIFLEEGQFVDEAKVGKVVILSNNKSTLYKYQEILSSDANTVIMPTNHLPGHFSKGGLAKVIPPGISPVHVNAMRHNGNFHRAVLHHVFRLSDRIRRDQENLNRQMGLSAESAENRKNLLTGRELAMPFLRSRRPYIAVHARIGAGIGENTGHRFKNISENVQVAASCLASRAVRLAFLGGAPPLSMYLATDTPEFRDVFQKAVYSYSNGSIYVNTGNWSVQHSTKLSSDTSKGLREENWDVMWGSYMDLVMLGHGEHILALYSSFPRLAQSLGNAETLTELRSHICFSK